MHKNKPIAPPHLPLHLRRLAYHYRCCSRQTVPHCCLDLKNLHPQVAQLPPQPNLILSLPLVDRLLRHIPVNCSRFLPSGKNLSQLIAIIRDDSLNPTDIPHQSPDQTPAYVSTPSDYRRRHSR